MFRRKFLTFSFVTALAFNVLPLSVQIHAAVSGRPPTLFATGSKQIRHALLVGISKYGAFGDLAGGPLRDVSDLGNLLADKKYGFQVHTLPEREATHDGIIAAFRKYLITDAEDGDVCLFFFSGHGTQINNTASPEEDKLDEALVPIDVKRPVTEKKDVKEIRDKELARLFNEALSKGVKLVIIIDSCHSGSIARGVNAAKVKKIDALMTVDMAVPPDLPDPIDPRNKEGKSPEERGALVMAAALDDESAEEHLYDGVYRGDFCKALLDVLRESDANKVSAEQLFLNVTARIRQDGRTQQHPTISKTLEARRRLTLFGDQPAGDPEQTEVTVVVDQLNETLAIQNGSDIGLTKGSEFKRKDSAAVRIRVSEEVTELGRAVAEIVPPAKLSDIQTGDVFEQDKWAPAGKPNLKVWIPPAKLSAADLHAIAAELSKLRSSDRVQWVDDPTEEDVTHLISFDESGWQLVKLDGTIAKLGNQPTADAVLKLLPASGQSKLFVYLPPSIELRNKIKLGEGTQKSAIAVTRTRDEAVYLLVGRLRKTATETTVEYAWVLPAATQGEAHNSANSAQPNNKPPPESLPLPPLTTWIDGNAAVADHNPVTALEDMALRLGKIKGWLGLTSPPQVRGHIFPYRLVINNIAKPNTEIRNGSELIECEKYDVELVAEPLALNPLPKQRYVYVLGLDKSGNSSLLYGSGNESNRWPTKVELDSGTALPRILLDDAAFIVVGPKGRCGINPNTGKPYDKGILGNETYILLTTEDPLPLPELLEFKGVRTPQDIQDEKRRGGNSDLQDLLSSIDGPMMSTRGTTSLNWSIQRLSFRSVEKMQLGP